MFVLKKHSEGPQSSLNEKKNIKWFNFQGRIYVYILN